MKRVFAEIDLQALAHNLNEIRKRVGKRLIIPIVKANAYGHGIIEISRHLIHNGIEILGVAFIEEAVRLRDAGIESPIIVLFESDNAGAFIRYNLIPTVFDLRSAKEFSESAYKRNLILPIHIKVDTGMGRIGIDIDSAEETIQKIIRMRNLKVEGLMSHLSSADLEDKDFTSYQVERFKGLVRSLKKRGITFKYLHIANSAGIMRFPESYLNAVRPGIMLYGYGGDSLIPVLSLKSKILHLKTVPPNTPISYGRTFITKRKGIIATIPIGYADGYSRRLSNIGEVLINGRRAPVVGRVCMDTIMVDVTDIHDIDIDSEVVLIGSSGKERVTAEEIADKIGTIPYEVLTSIGERVERVYISS
ncbi:MAG: alanine racemase [Thermodesulfovibrionia bacterium]